MWLLILCSMDAEQVTFCVDYWEHGKVSSQFHNSNSKSDSNKTLKIETSLISANITRLQTLLFVRYCQTVYKHASVWNIDPCFSWVTYIMPVKVTLHISRIPIDISRVTFKTAMIHGEYDEEHYWLWIYFLWLLHAMEVTKMKWFIFRIYMEMFWPCFCNNYFFTKVVELILTPPHWTVVTSVVVPWVLLVLSTLLTAWWAPGAIGSYAQLG